MKSLVIATFFLLLAMTPASAQTLDDLKSDGKNTDNVLTYGMGYRQNRYSPLKQIDKSNVKRLVPIWNLSLDNQWGEQAQPLVYDGVMYVTDAKATVAIDVETGKQIWKTPVDWPTEMTRVVCCGVSNKGPAILDGRLFRTTLDAFVIALDMKTGKEIWRQQAADWKQGYSMNAAPLVANGVVITGISGAEYGTRGFLDGWNPETGAHLWRRYTIPGPGEKGVETWPAGDAYLHGGGSTWITGSYDPELDLVYWGTGNAGPWNPAKRPGDNLYTASLLALRPKTGEIVWHYQFTPHDMYDYDATWEPILADMQVGGQARKVVMQLNRNGFLYVLDRTDGKLLSAKPYEKVNWATSIDLETGRPVESDVSKKLLAGEQVELWPSTRGGKNWPHAAFNPETGLLYANTQHMASLYRFVPLEPFVAGTRYQFVENKTAPHVDWRAHRACGRDRSADWRTALARAVDGPSALVLHRSHRRRIAFHREGNRGVHRDRRGDGQDRVAIPDGFGHQRSADYVHAQRKAIYYGLIRDRRALLERGAGISEERAARRIRMDVRAGAINQY